MSIGVSSLVNAGVGLAGSIFGGLGAAKQRKQMGQYLDQQDAENTAWYNANALSDYTQRADAQNLMKQLRDNLSKQNKIAANTAVITGATPEQQAVVQERSNKVISDTLGQLGAIGQQYKDRVTNQYLNRKNLLSSQRLGMMEGNALSYENIMGNGLDMLGGSLGSLLDGVTIGKEGES